jgi:peroxiredoxin
MKDISFKTYQNNKISENNAEELFQNKRVLVCSIIQTMGKGVANTYLKHLAESKENYTKLGLDEIYVVNSLDDDWLLPKVNAFFPGLIPIIDHKKKFLKFIEEKYHNNKINLTSTPYQVLIKNVEIEKIYVTDSESSFKDYELCKKLLKYIRNNILKISTVDFKKYKNLKQQLLIEGINRYILSLKDNDQKKYYDYRDIEYTFNRAFFYHDLWPNVSLREHLLKTKEN